MRVSDYFTISLLILFSLHGMTSTLSVLFYQYSVPIPVYFR